MTQALQDRLERVLDVTVRQAVMAAKQPQGANGPWVAPPPNRTIADVHVFVLHDTAGWSARTGKDLAQSRFAGASASGEYTQFLVSGDGTVFECIAAMDSNPRFTWHANWVNNWALGSETGHSWGNYGGNFHLGPHSQSRHQTLPNGDFGPQHGLPADLHTMPNNLWIPLSMDTEENDAQPGADVDDVPGLKCWFRWRSFNEVSVAWWTTERYAGPWRQTQRVAEMVFNEAHYRSWALLLRYSAEKHLIPRNFLLIPHKTRAAGAGTTPGGHDMLRDAASFAAIVRADEILSRSLTQLGAPGAALTEEDLTNGNRYRQAFTEAGVDRNEMWTRALQLYRGFHGHGTSGDPDRGRDHDCPGPMFDWFRLAREVWDWWWHPFDFNAARTSTLVDRRAYSAGWDGNTRLTEHYYNVPAQAYRDRRHEGVHGNTGSPKTYRLEQGSRVYAQATGELVAARFPAETGRVSMAWMIVRTDVYHQLHPRAGQPAAGNQPAVSAGRINYGVEPTSVYTLYMHIGRPAGMTFDRVDPVNPDWLNRMLMRKKEADMGNRFRTTPQTQPGWTVPDVAWNNRPPGDAEEALRLRAGRPTIAEAWAEDSVVYTRRLDRLARGEIMYIAPGVWTTPVKVLLGDFLGVAGVILRTQQQAPLHGIRVEVFSRDLISTDFALTVTDAIRGWQPPAGATRPALRYPSEWEEPPQDEVMLFLELFGVDTSLMGWFGDFRAVTQTNPMTPDDGRLADAAIVHYDPDDFMAWLNDKTWRSEWPKYRLTDPLPATPRMRPAA